MYKLKIPMKKGSGIQNQFSNFIYNYLPKKESDIEFSVIDYEDEKCNIIYEISTVNLYSIFDIGFIWFGYLLETKIKSIP